MGLYLIVIYLALIVSTFFISAVRNHKVIKRYTREVIYNDCYYLNPEDHKWNQKMAFKMSQEEEIKPSEEAHIKDNNANKDRDNNNDNSNLNILDNTKSPNDNMDNLSKEYYNY